MKTHKSYRHGFTLVEILLVVVILGVLAAIVVPQFSEASSEANRTNLMGNLQTIRTQIQLYKVQHDDLFPGQTVVDGNVAEADFAAALTTNDGRYGPYMKKIPDNLFVANAAGRKSVTCVNNAAAAPAGNEGTAWWFNAATGDFRACDSPEHIGF